MPTVEGDKIVGDALKFERFPTRGLRWYVEEGYVRLQQWWQSSFGEDGEWRDIPLMSADSSGSGIKIKLINNEHHSDD